MIEFKDISKIYDGKTVVNKQNFYIEKGEFFVLVGPSGSGKTTTLKMINRLIEPSNGEILIDGQTLGSLDLRKLRLNIGYVLQQIALFPNMTVMDNIELIPEMKKWKKANRDKRARELLLEVGMDPDKYLSRYPSELSGGEQQRVGILRAISANPKILLMDEPFSALDPISRNQLQDMILDIHEKFKMTIVFVTHDMHEALKLGDRICVMRDGNIIQIDSPENIINNPSSDFIREFFSLEDRNE